MIFKIFLEKFYVPSKIRRKGKGFPIYLLPRVCIILPFLIPPTSAITAVKTSDRILTHHNHPHWLVYFGFYSWCCTFPTFKEVYCVMDRALQFDRRYFCCPNYPLLWLFIPFPATPLTSGYHWSLYCLWVLPFAEYHVVGII